MTLRRFAIAVLALCALVATASSQEKNEGPAGGLRRFERHKDWVWGVLLLRLLA